jgi:zinc transport system substrate-binding protein
MRLAPLFAPLFAPIFALSASPALAEVPKVMTDIPPVQALVAQVMGELGAPGMFLDKGGDEHDLALRPSQMRDLAAAGLVVWVGPELTPGLASALDASGVAALALLDDPATRRLDYAGGGVNPHAWLDPRNAAAWAGLIAERLAALDPDNAAAYRANAAAAQKGIAALDAQLAAELAPIADKPFLAWHDAYSYFAGHYKLSYLGGLADGEAAPPGAARLSEVAALVAAGGVACVFPEEQHDPAVVAALGPVRLGAPLDPVGSMLDPGPDTYGALMQALSSALTDCLAP